ncbi:MAG TPA: prepilin peptidase [Candidatus Thermoplasmatota archaeon]|nr:prepilin peptidase [Candidatus Thermoplasmatota archaeon]
MTPWLEPRLLLALAMLLGASALDLRSRRVANPYWMPFLAFAAVLAAADLAAGRWLGLAVAAALCGLFYLFWRLRLFGGADAKGLMVLALLLPAGPGPVPAVLGSLMLASLFAGLAVPVLLLAWNLLHGRLALPAALLGLPLPMARARRSHVWPMQEPVPGAPGALRWRYFRHVGSDPQERLDALAAAGVTRPWVTPQVPFMVPLALGVAAWPALAAVLPWPAWPA